MGQRSHLIRTVLRSGDTRCPALSHQAQIVFISCSFFLFFVSSACCQFCPSPPQHFPSLCPHISRCVFSSFVRCRCRKCSPLRCAEVLCVSAFFSGVPLFFRGRWWKRVVALAILCFRRPLSVDFLSCGRVHVLDVELFVAHFGRVDRGAPVYSFSPQLRERSCNPASAIPHSGFVLFFFSCAFCVGFCMLSSCFNFVFSLKIRKCLQSRVLFRVSIVHDFIVSQGFGCHSILVAVM